MDISKRALTLATALVLGVTILGLTVEPAAAEKKGSKDDGVRCSIEGEILVSPPTDNDYEFFTPGHRVEAKSGPHSTTVYECQADGKWKEVAMTQPRVPGRLPSGSFTQTP